MRKKCDPRGDLEAAMHLEDPLGGLAKKFATWRGYNYNQVMRYADEEEVRLGFLEASTLYEPSMLEQDSLESVLVEQGHMRPDDESRAPSVRASMGSEVIRERQGKLLRIDRERQDMKIKFQAANVGTGQDLESSDAIFYGDIPMSMQYEHLENHDVAALDVLIHSSADERDTHIKDTFDAAGNLAVPVALPKSEAEAVVWLLGSCPSKHALHRAKRLFEDQLMNPYLPLLVVVLVSETRYDLPQTAAAALRMTAHPFAPLIEAFHSAVYSAKRKLTAKRNRRKKKMGDKYVPSFQDQLLEQALFREAQQAAKAGGGGGPTMMHSPSHNLCLARYVTWAEIVAGAFVKEDKYAHLRAEDKELLASKGGSGDEDDQAVKLPKCASLREQMAPYLPSWSVDLVIQRVDISDEPDEPEAEQDWGDEGEGTEGPNPEGDEARSDLSGLTSHSAGTNTDKDKDKEVYGKSKGDGGSRSKSLFGSIKRASRGIVNMIRSGGRKSRNVGAPTSTASEHVSGFDELTEMKFRFETEGRAAFSKELHMVVSRYVQTKETHEHEKKAHRRPPYNDEAREMNEARALPKELRPGEENKEGDDDTGSSEEEEGQGQGEGASDGCVIA
jgi:hypothetical protein